MNQYLHRAAAFLLCLSLLLSLAPMAAASGESTHQTQNALDISDEATVTVPRGFNGKAGLFDKNTHRAVRLPGDFKIKLEHPQGIGSAYLIFDQTYSTYTVTDTGTGKQVTFGTEGFLHAFLDLEAAFGYPPKTITLSFGEKAAYLNELYLFSSGAVPSFVQKWNTPKEGKTDLILFSTHGDDEQLFFAGLLPYYAGELGFEVLVAYLTDHSNTTTLRRHEMLDGLWAVGVTTYPVFGPFGDYYCKTKAAAYGAHKRNGETREELLGFVVEQLRRYKPLVAVGHDEKGEYGHGQHQMYSELLRQAVEAAADPTQYPALTAQWGAWDVPKTYIHLWQENPITMNWDIPLKRFGGMTAFQVTRDLGFPCHASQQWGFAWFLNYAERSSDIPKYSPCQYGLYRSTVGPDVDLGDFFENLVSYEEQERRAILAQQKKALYSLLTEKLAHMSSILMAAADGFPRS